MTEFNARISRVRMKEGADVHILNPAREEEPEGLEAAMLRQVKMIKGQSEPGSDLDGFIMIGLFSDGTSSMGYRAPKRLPRALLVAYLSEVLRRDVIMDAEAEEVFHNMFEWREGS
jgi:hypothetical protein